MCGSELGDSKSPQQAGVENTAAPEDTTGAFEPSDLPRDSTHKPLGGEEEPESGLDLTRVIPPRSLVGNNAQHEAAMNPESRGNFDKTSILLGKTVVMRGSQQTPGSDASVGSGVDSLAADIPGSHVVDQSAGDSLAPGTILAGRYQILSNLGQGGMGTVYKAHDIEVDRLVAIKIIRPDLASDASILQRFKQEVILSRQVTHRNVVRIYDLGVAGDLKFISMEFIEGRELTSLIDESGKLPQKHAAEIMLQVCRGLEAAHAAGVIHRDLKPQNIMMDTQGRVAVMDFGIAYSIGALEPTGTPTAGALEDRSSTQFGSLLGTPRYMSPEQAKGDTVDARSDIFTVGIIFYELLTGIVPFSAKTRKETVRKRLEDTPRQPIELDPRIGKTLNQIVLKCLEKDREKRYQSVADIIRGLEVYLGIRSKHDPAHLRRVRLLAAGLAVLLVAAAGFITWDQIRRKANKPHELVKVLLSEFDNRTGQPIFSKTLEPIMRDALERASFITVYNPLAAKKLASELRPGATRLDTSLARLVALREGLGIIISGVIEKHGGGFKLSASEMNPSDGKTLLSRAVDVASSSDIPQGIEKLAARIRRSLGDVSGTPKNLAAETFTSASLNAAQKYSEAQDMQWQGKWDDSISAYRKAIEFDPNFSRAYAGLAATLANQGQTQEALKYYRLALAHIGRMSDRETYRTRGGYYLLTRDYVKAAEQFGLLVSQYPADTSGISNLALAYFYARNMTAALTQAKRALEIYPENLLYRDNYALYALYSGDYNLAIGQFRLILQKNPGFQLADLGLGMAYLANGQSHEAEQIYNKVANLSRWGASQAALARADLYAYQGDLRLAEDALEKGFGQDMAAGDKAAAAVKLATLAGVQIERKQRAAAIASATKAASLSDDESVLYPAARVYIEARDKNQAFKLAGKLENHFEPDSRALGKLIEGEIALASGRPPDAVNLFQEGQKLADTWLGRFDLGLAYLAAERYPDAENEFDVCIKRRGEATAVYLNDEPTLRYIPPVYYYEGRAREGLQSATASEFYRTFVTMKLANPVDPLVLDAKRRLK
ncbi:MAG: protein kinase domain-containing protein [Bryobacteraceae bacterium]